MLRNDGAVELRLVFDVTFSSAAPPIRSIKVMVINSIRLSDELVATFTK